MKLWILKPKENLKDDDNPWKPWYDKVFGFVIRANTEEEARQIASRSAGREKWKKSASWINPKYSTCDELIQYGEAKVILRDFRSS